MYKSRRRKGNCYGTLLSQLQRVYRNWHVCRGGKKGHLPKPKLFNAKLRWTRHTDHKNGTIVLFIKIFGELLFLLRQDWSEGNGQYNQYQHIYIDFFNVIQLAWDIEWIIAGHEAHNNDVSWAFKNNVKVTVNTNLSTPVCTLYIEIDICVLAHL